MIEVHNLTKDFKTPVVREGRFSGLRTLFSREYRLKEAVCGISFQVERGEFVGYIGPNGAGKSTTIKMLTGILHPTSGEVRVGGVNPHRDRRQAVRQLGVVFGQRSQLWWDLPVKDSYDILAEMYGVSSAEKAQRLDQFGELLDLHEFWLTPVRKLSLGQRMRADIAAAMLHDPELLFLDEPTIGLDVHAKRNIRQFLLKLNRDFGKTILLTTHDMDDIEQLCNRVMVIDQGRLTYDGTIPALREQIGLPTVIRVKFRGPFRVPEEAEAGRLPFRVTGTEEDTVVVEANRHEIGTMEIIRVLSDWGDIDDVDMAEPAFEEVIRSFSAS
ncbi:Methionine import ATP-binding protein MetN [compost metagenome]|uniref:ABC transporter ATP-binding protein n=1 Tax=Paenibacillus TaxID=44249 RepID=UPI000F935377|nr:MULTISPECIES: ATP-binding cassette domain-containing protein [Paenibacillus]MUG86640.1 ATP-binding cassette domain-containing protein [Paenibacillus timonensis]GIP49781.1 ABC transporter ATP-binding protein [Paenibacillus sp. J53TS2]